MDFKTFKEYCNQLLTFDTWRWSDNDDMLIFCKRLQVDDQSDTILDDFQEIEDVARYIPPAAKRTVNLEIHILYSVIWDAPECYLNMYWDDTGEMLTIDRFCSLINKPIPKLLTQRVFKFILILDASSL